MVAFGYAFFALSTGMNFLGGSALTLGTMRLLDASNASTLLPRVGEGALVGMLATAELYCLLKRPDLMPLLGRLVAFGDLLYLLPRVWAYYIGWRPGPDDRSLELFGAIWAPLEALMMLFLVN